MNGVYMKRLLFFGILSAYTVFGQNQAPGVPGQPGRAAQPQGPPKQSADGMDFYRRNPQLMKRYFPQYPTGVPAPAAETPGPAGMTIGEVKFSGDTARDLADLQAHVVEPA